MQSTPVVVLAGLAAGAVGALAITRFAPVPVPAAVTRAPEGRKLSYPSFWDRQFSARLASVESRLDDLALKQPAPLASEAGPLRDNAQARAEAEPLRDNAQARAAAYEANVLEQQKAVTEHNQEPIDATWASAEQQTIESALQPLLSANDSMRRVNVDCRSKTCVTRVTYASPDDALEQHSQLLRVVGKGCHGVSSTLQPPLSAGAYEAISIHYCR
jgi:hypothetical protein